MFAKIKAAFNRLFVKGGAKQYAFAIAGFAISVTLGFLLSGMFVMAIVEVLMITAVFIFICVIAEMAIPQKEA